MIGARKGLVCSWPGFFAPHAFELSVLSTGVAGWGGGHHGGWHTAVIEHTHTHTHGCAVWRTHAVSLCLGVGGVRVSGVPVPLHFCATSSMSVVHDAVTV